MVRARRTVAVMRLRSRVVILRLPRLRGRRGAGPLAFLVTSDDYGVFRGLMWRSASPKPLRPGSPKGVPLRPIRLPAGCDPRRRCAGASDADKGRGMISSRDEQGGLTFVGT